MFKRALALSFVSISVLGGISALTESAPTEATAPVRFVDEAQVEQAIQKEPRVVPAVRAQTPRRTLRASCADCVVG